LRLTWGIWKATSWGIKPTRTNHSYRRLSERSRLPPKRALANPTMIPATTASSKNTNYPVTLPMHAGAPAARRNITAVATNAIKRVLDIITPPKK
jgi:hypothetical protein